MNTHQLCLILCSHSLFLLHFLFYLTSILQAVYVIFTPLHPPFYFLLLLPLSCWYALRSPRLTHTRADLTISPIQPPKSNYHGQNRVIKSNELLDEVHSQKQKSFGTLIHIIQCATCFLTDFTVTTYTFSYEVEMTYITLNVLSWNQKYLFSWNECG